MKGFEFKAQIKEAGYTQERFADIMGVDRTVIIRQGKKDDIDPVWAFAIAGLMAARGLDAVRRAVGTMSLDP